MRQALQAAGHPFGCKPHRPPDSRRHRLGSTGRIAAARMRGQVIVQRSVGKQRSTPGALTRPTAARIAGPISLPTRPQSPGRRCQRTRKQPHGNARKPLLQPNRSRRPTREAIQIQATSTTAASTASTAPSPNPVRAERGSKNSAALASRPSKCQQNMTPSRSSFDKSARLPLGGFTHS